MHPLERQVRRVHEQVVQEPLRVHLAVSVATLKPLFQLKPWHGRCFTGLHQGVPLVETQLPDRTDEGPGLDPIDLRDACEVVFGHGHKIALALNNQATTSL